MTNFNGFKGAAKPLDDVDLPRLASRINCGEDELHTLLDVESAGKSFDDQGRPPILFEPHVFYRNLTGAKRDKAVAQGLAYPKWKAGAYGSTASQYIKLEKALKIDETAALKACSWGPFQILGENFKAVGYTSVQKMVLAFMDDAENALNGAIQFCISNHIDDDLREHRWDVVARVYNGPGKVADYSAKLKKAYTKWSRIPDTKWSPEDVRPAPTVEPTESPEDAPEPIVATVVPDKMLEATQQRLLDLGYYLAGKPDGCAGKFTAAAIAAFQVQNKIPLTAKLDSATMDAIWAKDAPKMEVSSERSEATSSSPELKDSTIIDAAKKQKSGAAATGGIMGFFTVIAMVKSWLNDFLGGLPDLVLEGLKGLPVWVYPAAFGLLCVFFWYQANRAEVARVLMHQKAKMG